MLVEAAEALAGGEVDDDQSVGALGGAVGDVGGAVDGAAGGGGGAGGALGGGNLGSLGGELGLRSGRLPTAVAGSCGPESPTVRSKRTSLR